jgi:hypothetical protein
MAPAQLAEDGNSVRIFHVKIGQDKIELAIAKLRDGFLAAERHLYGKSFSPENLTHGYRDVDFIVDDEE